MGKKAKMEYPQSAPWSSSMANLSTPLLMEIFRRLAVRALLAARIVCKSWLLLISDTHFAKLHSTTAPTELLVQFRRKDAISLDLCLGEFEMLNSSLSKVHFNFLLRLPRVDVSPDRNDDDGVNPICNCWIACHCRGIRLVNWCNGLVCYCSDGVFKGSALIWNPITSQYVRVPTSRRFDTVVPSSYGFGFSPKAKRFKLLRLVPPSASSTNSKHIAEVFTLEEGAFSWRNVGYFPVRLLETVRGVFMEGAIHWVIKDHNDIVIVSFDSDNEQFGSVPLPPPFDGIGKNFICRVPVSLGVLGGCLSLTDLTHRGCIDTWVMKEYGIRDSWAKVFSIEEKPELSKRNNDDFQVIKYMENGEILMLKCRQYLVSYDPAKNSIRTIGRAPTCELEAVAYSPSLFRFEDAMMGYPVHVLHVKLRPTASEIRGSETNDGSIPWCKYWWINEIRATNLRDASEHIGEVLRHAKELLKRAYKINTR